MQNKREKTARQPIIIVPELYNNQKRNYMYKHHFIRIPNPYTKGN